MFDIGLMEMMVVGIVALIVVGPEDLPGMFRTVGKAVGRMRGMARDFQKSMDMAADESGLRDIAGDLRKMANPKKMGLDALKDAANPLKDLDPSKYEVGSSTQKLAEKRAEDARKAKLAAAERTKKTVEAKEKVAAEAPAAPVTSATAAAAAPAAATASPAATPEPAASAKPKPKRKPKAKVLPPVEATKE